MHGLLKIRSREVGRPPVLAVPGVGVFVAQQITEIDQLTRMTGQQEYQYRLNTWKNINQATQPTGDLLACTFASGGASGT